MFLEFRKKFCIFKKLISFLVHSVFVFLSKMLARPRKTREFTGPTPHSVAIEERTQTTRPRDYLIRERHRNEQQRQVAIDQKVAQEAFDLKNEWEKQTDRQFKVSQ